MPICFGDFPASAATGSAVPVISRYTTIMWLKHVKTMPFAPSPSHHHEYIFIYRWYIYIHIFTLPIFMGGKNDMVGKPTIVVGVDLRKKINPNSKRGCV